mgnify:CR=1 FL=1|tara:strand:+ start:1840 stop:4608 length:2769 start_codon:yes stop_codon:yes gene_type:complete
MLLLDETSLEIGPEYTEDIHLDRFTLSIRDAGPPPAPGAQAAVTAVSPLTPAEKKASIAGVISEASIAAEQNRASDTPAGKPPKTPGDKNVTESPISKIFEEQCFILDALEDFSRGNRNTDYKNFIVLEGSKDDAALLVSKVNSRFGKSTNGLEQFMNITPSQYSMLIPKIRLYVQKRRGEKDKFGMMQELKFKDFTSKSSVSDIMTSAAGRGDDAGLVSFSYEFDGRDPGSVTNMIKGNIRLLFTDFDTFVKPIREATPEEREYFSPTDPDEEEYLRPRFLDMIIRQPTRKKIKGSSLPFLTRLHAEIGWHAPVDSTAGELFPSELKKYISDGYLNEYMVLDILEHEMDFKEDGRIELSVSYRSNIENALFNNTDILSLGKELEKSAKENVEKGKNALTVTQKINAIAQKRKGNPDAKLVVTSAGEEDQEFSNDTWFGDDLAAASKIVKAQEQKIKYTKETQKLSRYRKLLNSLADSEKIRFIDLKPELIKTWISELGLANLHPDDPALQNSRTTAAAIMRSSGVITSAPGAPSQLISQSAPEAQSLNAAKGGLEAMEKHEKERLQAAKDGKTVAARSRPKSNLTYDKTKADQTPSGQHRIHFMYLGDVIDIACAGLYELEPHHGLIRIVTGPVQYLSSKDNKMKNVNLADIPISLEAMSDWIYRRIISKGLTTLSIGEFLSSLITDLAYESLGQRKCFGSIKEHPSLMMSPIVLNLSGPAAGEMTEPVERASGVYPRMTVDDFSARAKNNLASRGSLIGRKKITNANYIFLTGVIREENNFNYGISSFNVDFHKNGVYNLGIGRDRGIVKNINFVKSDAPYQTEMRVEQRESGQSFSLGEFRQVYNATVKLVGNTLFRNGQYVRLDPSTMGLDPRTAIQLGLGGMYVITKVDGELSKAGYTTTLTCKYNSTGESGRKTKD